MRLFNLRPLLALCAIVAAVAFIATDADARGGRSGGMGSRGSQTHSAPPSTATAPNAARPMERTATQPGSPAAPRAATTPSTTGAGGGFFNRPGFMGGLLGGLVGAGLFGMLMGHGFGGGLGGFASILGLLLQVGIIALVAYLIWTWWQRRQHPATAVASGPALHNYSAPSGNNYSATNAAMDTGGSTAPVQERAAGTDEVGLTPEDFNNFERMLTEVQTAYGKEDLSTLRGLVTPELVSYYSEDLAENASRGIINRISDIKLQQGDLSEAWREGDVDYATVALRYTLNDQVVDRATDKVTEQLDGEATEIWTFMRARGGKWLVTAVQQTEGQA